MGDAPHNEALDNPPDRLVPMRKITITFDDKKILEKINDELLNQAKITGAFIVPVEATYHFDGERKSQTHYQLVFFIPSDTPQKEWLGIESIIRARWKVPLIVSEREEVQVNAAFELYARSARAACEEVERTQRVNRVLRGVVASLTLLLAAGVLYGEKKYLESERSAAARAAEQKASMKAYGDMAKLSQELDALLINPTTGLGKRFLRHEVLGKDGKYRWIIEVEESDKGTECNEVPLQLWNAIDRVRELENDTKGRAMEQKK